MYNRVDEKPFEKAQKKQLKIRAFLRAPGCQKNMCFSSNYKPKPASYENSYLCPHFNQRQRTGY